MVLVVYDLLSSHKKVILLPSLGVGEQQYELRLYRKGSQEYAMLTPYAVNFIGHQRKQYGFLSNREFQNAIGERVGRRLH